MPALGVIPRSGVGVINPIPQKQFPAEIIAMNLEVLELGWHKLSSLTLLWWLAKKRHLFLSYLHPTMEPSRAPNFGRP
jgi:hypothetical protein